MNKQESLPNLGDVWVNEYTIQTQVVKVMDKQYPLNELAVPNSPETEERLLGMLLALVSTGQSVAVVEQHNYISKRDFYLLKHGFLFDAIVNCYRQENISLDAIFVEMASQRRGKGKSRLEYFEGGKAEIVALSMRYVPAKVTIESLFKLINNESIQRQLIIMAEVMKQEAMKPSNDCKEDLVMRSLAHVQALRLRQAKSAQQDTQSLPDSVETYTEQVVKESTEGHYQAGIPIWIKGLNETLLGWRPNKLYTIAAGTGMGKTFFGINIALTALYQQKRVAYLSLELDIEEILERVMPIVSGIPSKKLQSRQLSSEDLVRLRNASAHLSSQKFAKEFTLTRLNNPTLEEITAKLNELYLQNPPDIIIIDYAGIETISPSYKNLSSTDHATRIWSTMRTISDSYNCPVIVMTQVNRNYMSNPDKRPNKTDIANSSVAEKASDVLMILHRPSEVGIKNLPHSYSDITIVKNRTGEMKSGIKMHFDGTRGLFSDWKEPEIGLV